MNYEEPRKLESQPINSMANPFTRENKQRRHRFG